MSSPYCHSPISPGLLWVQRAASSYQGGPSLVAHCLVAVPSPHGKLCRWDLIGEGEHEKLEGVDRAACCTLYAIGELMFLPLEQQC